MTTDSVLADLIDRIAAGDHQAMAEFYTATRAVLDIRVRRWIRSKWSADEVVQDVYTQVWLSAGSFCADRGSPLGWLSMIARSRAFDCLRRGQRHAELPIFEDTGGRSFSVEGVTPFEIGLVRREIAQLPDLQRRLLELAYTDGYSHSEIAALTGIPIGTVKGRIRAALSRIRLRLCPGDDQPALIASGGDLAA